MYTHAHSNIVHYVFCGSEFFHSNINNILFILYEKRTYFLYLNFCWYLKKISAKKCMNNICVCVCVCTFLFIFSHSIFLSCNHFYRKYFWYMSERMSFHGAVNFGFFCTKDASACMFIKDLFIIPLFFQCIHSKCNVYNMYSRRR